MYSASTSIIKCVAKIAENNEYILVVVWNALLQSAIGGWILWCSGAIFVHYIPRGLTLKFNSKSQKKTDEQDKDSFPGKKKKKMEGKKEKV